MMPPGVLPAGTRVELSGEDGEVVVAELARDAQMHERGRAGFYSGTVRVVLPFSFLRQFHIGDVLRTCVDEQDMVLPIQVKCNYCGAEPLHPCRPMLGKHAPDEGHIVRAAMAQESERTGHPPAVPIPIVANPLWPTGEANEAPHQAAPEHWEDLDLFGDPPAAPQSEAGGDAHSPPLTYEDLFD